MPKIVRVDSLASDTMDIQLDNGSIVLLNMKPLMADPAFAALLEDDRILYPKTDGISVFWRDGPRLSVSEIFTLMSGNTKEETEQ